MAKANLQVKLLTSLKAHALVVNEVINDPEFSKQPSTVRLAVNIYTRTLALTVSNWEKVFDENSS